jgi:hypothetical protein
MQRWFIVAVLCALPLALLAACGDDDDGNSGSAPTSAASAPGGTQPQASATAATSAEALAAIKQLSTKLDAATFRATYDVKSDAAAGNLAGTLTLAAQPPAKVFDYRGKTPLGTGAYVILQNSTGSYLCLEVQGSKNCAKSGSGTPASSIGLPAGLSVESIIDGVVSDPAATASELAGRTVAGQPGRCFQVNGSSTKGTLCVTGEGVPLLVDGQFQGAQWTITATAVGAPTGTDFEPPFPVAS